LKLKDKSMRKIPPALQAKLDTGLTTLASCHIVTRKDGVKQGFTDHDRDLLVDGVLCLASTGFSATEITERLGFAISGGEVAGGLIDDSLTEDDILRGLYDGASIAIYMVDWSEPALKVLLRSGTIGEITREGASFKAEIRSRLTDLDVEKGRSYIPTCQALVGDAQCKIALVNAIGTVTVLGSSSDFHCSGLAAFAPSYFTQGKLTWVTGENAGVAGEVHYSNGSTMVLFAEMPMPIALGDMFNVSAGCDKYFKTCREKFNNIVNFRGFPHIPGNDFLSTIPIPGEGSNDGGSL
jgi:uncharacterized phage protein (TIGR02218 family)